MGKEIVIHTPDNVGKPGVSAFTGDQDYWGTALDLMQGRRDVTILGHEARNALRRHELLSDGGREEEAEEQLNSFALATLLARRVQPIDSTDLHVRVYKTRNKPFHRTSANQLELILPDPIKRYGKLVIARRLSDLTPDFVRATGFSEDHRIAATELLEVPGYEVHEETGDERLARIINEAVIADRQMEDANNMPEMLELLRIKQMSCHEMFAIWASRKIQGRSDNPVSVLIGRVEKNKRHKSEPDEIEVNVRDEAGKVLRTRTTAPWELPESEERHAMLEAMRMIPTANVFDYKTPALPQR